MKMVFLLLVSSCFHAQAAGQEISISKTNAPLKEIFQSIEKQSGYLFIYESGIIDPHVKKTINFHNVSIDQVLNKCFEGTSLDYEIIAKNIVIRKQIAKKSAIADKRTITGRVTDINNNPLEGASVYLKSDEKIGTITDKTGNFSLTIPNDAKVLVVNFVGFTSREIIITSTRGYQVVLFFLSTGYGA